MVLSMTPTGLSLLMIAQPCRGAAVEREFGWLTPDLLCGLIVCGLINEVWAAHEQRGAASRPSPLPTLLCQPTALPVTPPPCLFLPAAQ